MNLIYNSDFSKGTDSWTGTNITASGGVVTLKGDLLQNIAYAVPVASNRRYRLTFDLKVNTNSGQSFYIALRPFDNNKRAIDIATVYKPWSGTETTLSSAIANGDTTAVLTSGTGWTVHTNGRIGICDRLAWGYNRASYYLKWTAISGNTITLNSAWAGGSFPAGTKVCEFSAGGTYFYPWYTGTANLPSDWTTYTVEFNGGNSMRYSCQYFQFSTLGYNHEYSMRNIKFECISDYQEPLWYGYDETPSFTKQGIVYAPNFMSYGMPVRYVRDTTNGSDKNNYNHWNEIEIYNYVDENLAWGKTLTVSGTTFANSVATDGTVNNSYIDPGTGTKTAQIDLGYVEYINKIKIWHYYADGRIYNDNKTEVSIDGTNWITVYEGKKAETSAGNEIILSPHMVSIYNTGMIGANEFIEY